MRSFYVLIGLGLALAVLAVVVRTGVLARRNPGRPINAAMRLALETPQLTSQDAAVIEQRFPNAHRSPTGLMYVVRAPGEGATPTVGSSVTVNYDGRLLDGTQFDSSAAHGRPFTFRVGTGEVIKGWDEAFLGMRRGERRTLIIPYWLAYGDSAAGKIPPRATLVFDVELVAIGP